MHGRGGVADSKITRLHPVQGFCAEAGGALTLFLATYLGIPVSTTHTITGAVIGGVLGGLVGFLGPDAPSSSLLQEIILLASTGAIIVGLLAAVLYLLVDRRSLGS